MSGLSLFRMSSLFFSMLYSLIQKSLIFKKLLCHIRWLSTFSINLIAHTLEVTTLNRLHVGAKVNLEVDLIARYVERMLNPEA